VISGGESFEYSRAVLEEPRLEVAGDADIENSRVTAQDV
jgi:hypothetical protein